MSPGLARACAETRPRRRQRRAGRRLRSCAGDGVANLWTFERALTLGDGTGRRCAAEHALRAYVLALFAAGSLHGVAAVVGADSRQWELEVPIPPLGNHENRSALLSTQCLQLCSCRLISVLFSVCAYDSFLKIRVNPRFQRRGLGHPVSYDSMLQPNLTCKV